MTQKKSPHLKIDILTLFPGMFKGPVDESIIKRAIDKNLVEINMHNLRDWAKDKHKTVDDRPYGGGVGMILKPESIFAAVGNLRAPGALKKAPGASRNSEKVILLSPQGQPFNQQKAEELSKAKHLILICGRYEGVDERVREHLIDEEISIGDYILTGGEIPAMVLTDAITRLIPGVLEKPEALTNESFSRSEAEIPSDLEREKRVERESRGTSQLLEAPQYTRPENFRGYKVPKVLLSGDHKKIAQWRKKQSLLKTRQKRPDLLRKAS